MMMVAQILFCAFLILMGLSSAHFNAVFEAWAIERQLPADLYLLGLVIFVVLMSSALTIFATYGLPEALEIFNGD